MAKMLDFSKAKKPTLPVKFDDGSMVHVYTPSKIQFDEMTEAQEYFDQALEGDRGAMDRLYDITATLMSNNKTGREIAVDELAGYLDVSDIVLFFRAYAQFISEVIAEKN